MEATATASEPRVRPIVRLIGCDGNAFNILAKTKRALIQAGQQDMVESFMQEATSGDYGHLLATVMRYCEVE